MTTKIGTSLFCILLIASFQAFTMKDVPKHLFKSYRKQQKLFFDAVREGHTNEVAHYLDSSYSDIDIPDIKLALLMAVKKNRKETTKMLFDYLIKCNRIKEPSQLLDKIYEELSVHQPQEFERIRSYILSLYEEQGNNNTTTTLAFNHQRSIRSDSAPGLAGTPGPQGLPSNPDPNNAPGDQRPAGAPGAPGFVDFVFDDDTYARNSRINGIILEPFFKAVRKGNINHVALYLHPRYSAIGIPNIKLALLMAIKNNHKEITKILFDYLIKVNSIKEPSQLLDKIYEELSVHQPQEFERIRSYILALYENIITTPAVTPLVGENLPTTVSTPPGSPAMAFTGGQTR